MIKISRVEAYQSFDENDFSVMEDELYMCFNSDHRGEREQTHQFFLLDETTIILEIYWDGERVHEVSFENKSELTKRAITLSAEQKKNTAVENEEEKIMENKSNDLEEVLVNLEVRLETLDGTKELLEDVLEEFTAASFSTDSKERYGLARHKMMTLLTLMGYELKGLEETVNDIRKMDKGEAK